jgi:hypothetical protein
MGAETIEEMRSDAALVLGEGAETAAGMDGILAETLLDRIVDHALQPTAMDRKLRHVVAGMDAAHFAPDLMAVTVEIVQLVRTDRDGVELIEQT